MPSAPITARTLLWEALPDGTIVLLDWQLVETSLGTMAELRCVNRSDGNSRDEDLLENGYTQLMKMSASTLYATYNVGGRQWPHYRVEEPGPLG